MDDVNEDEVVEVSLTRRDLRILAMALLEIRTEGFILDWEYPIRLGGEPEYVDALQARLSSLRHG